jgi:menaquinone-dependent protoporphyrinogen oxidase
MTRGQIEPSSAMPTAPTAAPASARRTALKRIAAGLAGAAALTAGLVGWALHRPSVVMAQGRCSAGAPVKKKVLVAYASRAGSTGEIAQVISERLCALGFDAEVLPVESVRALAGFEAVVLGSAIRYADWLPEMNQFIATRRAELAQLPVAIFTAHILALGDDASSQATRAGYTQNVRALLTPRDEAFFSGKLDPLTLSFFDRMAAKLVKAPVGDRRDWARIRLWADALGPKLM